MPLLTCKYFLLKHQCRGTCTVFLVALRLSSNRGSRAVTSCISTSSGRATNWGRSILNHETVHVTSHFTCCDVTMSHESKYPRNRDGEQYSRGWVTIPASVQQQSVCSSFSTSSYWSWNPRLSPCHRHRHLLHPCLLSELHLLVYHLLWLSLKSQYYTIKIKSMIWKWFYRGLVLKFLQLNWRCGFFWSFLYSTGPIITV